MNEKQNKATEPTALVIFGATGDLAQRKLYPSLYDLYRKELLPKKFKIIAFGRREFSQSEYADFVERCISSGEIKSPKEIEFLSNIEYVRGNFDNDDSYTVLQKTLTKVDEQFNICTSKLFYLAVPPNLYELILTKLNKSGLSIPCGGDKGWTRILIEKPFGKDLDNAMRLDKLLGKLFKESQIFRIDHYLAKETIQNILAFRFSNSIFEPLWTKKYIERISIKMFESGTVGDRGVFYDGIGALRDIGQNHLLAMLALIAMEYPREMTAVAIRKERAKALKNLSTLKFADLKKVIRAQYEGYHDSPGVEEKSDTETFFRLSAEIKNTRWAGVPIELSAGKGLSETKTEISIDFKDVKMGKGDMPSNQNRLIFRIQPNDGISVLFWVKTPGFETYSVHPQMLSFNYADSDATKMAPEAYERVLFDCIRGDQTLFASTEEMEAQWKFINPILKSWSKNPLKIYNIGSKPEEIV